MSGGGITGDGGDLGRPRGIGSIVDAAVALYAQNATALWKVIATILAPVYALDELVVGLSLPRGSFVQNGTLYTQGGPVSLSAVDSVATIVLGLVAALIVQGALAVSLVDAYAGRRIDWRDSLREAAGRLRSLLWLAIFATVALIIAFVALILPGVWLGVAWTVSMPALMIEELGAVAALRRSFALVRGRWWATFGLLLVVGILGFIVLLIVGLAISALQSGVGSIVVWLLLRFLSSLLSGLIALPFFAAVVAVLYVDLRVRKEGLDPRRLVRSPGGAGAREPGVSSWD